MSVKCSLIYGQLVDVSIQKFSIFLERIQTTIVFVPTVHSVKVVQHASKLHSKLAVCFENIFKNDPSLVLCINFPK